ncbi:hypothetical protein CCACVL1_26316 [Corchorus capsularis]|uniref:Uncharacterized protein n=1 Tax=Corchorus capsularis TaxID=210143 RepID=A0A1R3GFA3_COCAP|nr:hypothetical protein CCACVL1_26316 [Corchorus capsularis]
MEEEATIISAVDGQLMREIMAWNTMSGASTFLDRTLPLKGC